MGLAWAATGDSSRHPHWRTFPHPGPPLLPPFGPSSTSITPNNLHPRALLYHPTNRPLFPRPPPEREKPAASRPGSGLFPPLPVTSPALPDWPMLRQWRHTGLAHWPTRFIDISTVHPLSSPQKWVTRTGVARTRSVLSQILTLSLFFFPSPPFLSLSPLFPRTLCILLPYSLPSSITLYVEAWRFRRVSSEISAATFSYQPEYARKNYMLAENRYFFVIGTLSNFCSMFFKINNFAFCNFLLFCYSDKEILQILS